MMSALEARSKSAEQVINMYQPILDKIDNAIQSKVSVGQTTVRVDVSEDLSAVTKTYIINKMVGLGYAIKYESNLPSQLDLIGNGHKNSYYFIINW